MGRIANIACKTVGIAGMSAVLYDAFTLGKKQSKRTVLNDQADTFESIVASTRTTTSASPTTIAIQKKVADWRMKNPGLPLVSKIKGFCKGVTNSVVDNAIPLIFASLAIAKKGFWSKVGAWGVAAWGLLTVLKEGFGLGKENPMGK